jgi:hypothetical protein
MGTDSFTPDHGVLLAKNKTPELAPWKWVIDAHPEDIDKVDFVRPDGTPVKVTKGDYRQLADALFHAGTGPGVVSEFEDTANRLHFYVLENKRDDEGVLSYRVAVRSLDGGGPASRGVETAQGDVVQARAGRVAVHSFRVTNTGGDEDLIRVSAGTAGGWATTLRSNVLDIPAGETETVRVYVSVPAKERGSTALTFTATSETDPEAKSSQTATVAPLPPRAARLRLAPAGRKCIRGGRVKLRLVSSAPLARARVSTPRRRARTITGTALTRPLRLRGLRGKRVTVRVAARTTDGTRIVAKRKLRRCRASS